MNNKDEQDMQDFWSKNKPETTRVKDGEYVASEEIVKLKKHNFLKLPSDVRIEELGHYPEVADGFGANYTQKSIGGEYNLTCTVFGYEVTEFEALLLIQKLNQYLANIYAHRVKGS